MEYKNYKGQSVNFKQLTQGHLSNMYWFNKICNRFSESSLIFIKDEINKRFNGEMLPYNPQWEFKNEIEFLDKNNYFKWNKEKTKADIVYLGQVVGHYETPEYIRETKLKKLLE